MAGWTVFGVTVWKSPTEKELNKLFDRYKKTLSDQNLKISYQINEWRHQLIHDINEYVDKQKGLLEEQYDDELNCLDDKRQNFLDILRACEKNNDTKQIQRLVDLCNSLQAELATLKYRQQSVKFIQVVRAEAASVNMDEFDIVESRNGRSSKTSIFEDDHEMENKYTDSFPMTTDTSATQISSAKPSAMNFTNGHNRSSSYNDNENHYDTRDDNISEKCPVCFMIFPSTMTARDQSQHIEEHYRDD